MQDVRRNYVCGGREVICKLSILSTQMFCKPNCFKKQSINLYAFLVLFPPPHPLSSLRSWSWPAGVSSMIFFRKASLRDSKDCSFSTPNKGWGNTLSLKTPLFLQSNRRGFTLWKRLQIASSQLRSDFPTKRIFYKHTESVLRFIFRFEITEKEPQSGSVLQHTL